MTDTIYMNTWDGKTDAHFTHRRVPVSVRSARGTLVERFVEPTRKDTYRDIFTDGVPTLATIVFAKENGRHFASNEPRPIGFTEGTYLGGEFWHGGVESTLQWVLKCKPWGIEFANEEPMPWGGYEPFLEMTLRLRDKISPETRVMVGYGLNAQGWERMRNGAALLDPDKGDGIAPHLLNPRKFESDVAVCKMLRDKYGVAVYPDEHRPMMGRFYWDDLELLHDEFNCVPAFPSGLNPWGDPDNNGVLFTPPYSHYTNGMRTKAADIWDEFTEGEQPEPVPDPVYEPNKTVGHLLDDIGNAQEALDTAKTRLHEAYQRINRQVDKGRKGWAK